MSTLAANDDGTKPGQELEEEKIVCGNCLKVVVEIPRNPSEDSVMCTQCEIWYHVECTNKIGLDDDWECSFCQK